MRSIQTLLSVAILLLCSTSITNAQSCNPTNCKASCSPSCSINDVCTLGTMITCGVCPDSKCISRVALGLPPISTPSTDTNSSGVNAGLIGGVVGGLLGGGLIFGTLAYLFIRRRNKSKNSLPLAFRSNNKQSQQQRSLGDEEVPSNRQMSGVIPVTFIPPASSSVDLSMEEQAETPRSRYGSYATFANNNHDDDDAENPFSDRPISNAHSIMTATSTATHSRRGSVESTISHQQTATIVQATQVMRAKPQIMRVNTVKVQDGLTRSGSFKKTILPDKSNGNRSSMNTTTDDNPFDDKNKVGSTANVPTENSSRNSPLQQQQQQRTTDSVVSAPGDGEITIFWNGS